MVLNGRNPLFLALLKPGVRGGSLAGFNRGLTSGGFSINGSRSQDNLITFDGAVAVRTRSNGTVDRRRRPRFLAGNAGPHRQLHRRVRPYRRRPDPYRHQERHERIPRSVYEYFRNEKLDANSWSNNRAGSPRPRNFNQFGYNASGPVFIPQVQRREEQGLLALEPGVGAPPVGQTVTITCLAGHAGRRLPELLNPIEPVLRRGAVVKDPDTGATFANNVIPASRLSPNGIGMLNASPEPTPGFQQGTTNRIQTGRSRPISGKDTLSLDVLPSENHTFRFRFQNYDFVDTDAFGGGTDRAHASSTGRTGRTL